MRLTVSALPAPLKPFEEINLNSFSVIIGPNGVGKTQFLRAIAHKNISVQKPINRSSLQGDLVGWSNPIEQDKITMITNLNYEVALESPNNQPFTGYNKIPLGSVSSTKINLLWPVVRRLEEKVGRNFDEYTNEGIDFWAFGPQKFIEDAGFVGDEEKSRMVFESFEEADRLLMDPPSRVDGYDWTIGQKIRQVSKILEINPTEINHDLLKDYASVGEIKAFQPNIDMVIAHYRDMISNNDLAERNGERRLTEEEFSFKYGPPPWQILDDVIQSFGLKYQVARPVFLSPPPTYRFALKQLEGETVIEPNALSSGQKTLLRFALAMMAYDPIRFKVNMPELILLDELDSLLHPQMIPHWINTIKYEFTEKRGINCILATHSPITVALLPDECLYEMTEETACPTKITKQQALNKLTVGLPTLAIDYSGQRQVFVESDTDAKIYNIIMSDLKKTFALSRSLYFISTGYRLKHNNTEENAGFGVVTSVVSELRRSGNRSVFGLVDWDGKRTSKNNILVMAEGTHYTLENILLDPLLLGILLLRYSKETIFGDVRLADITLGDRQLLQGISNAVQAKIFPALDLTADLKNVCYVNAPNLMVQERYLTTPGHDLETYIVNSFPYLDRYKNNRGALPLEIVKGVISAYPMFCPQPIIEAFRKISETES